MGKMKQEIIPRDILHRAFPGIKKDEADEMISKGILRMFIPETIICREGAREDTFFIILDGEVEVAKWINESELRILKKLKPGDFFGEMAIIHDAPRAASVTAISSVTALEINRQAFSNLLERSSSMSVAMVREVSRRLRENDEMAIEDLRKKAVELADAYQRLADQEKARSQFLTTIAHELRTPLTAANGFMQLAQSGSLEGPMLLAVLDPIARNLQEITTLVNDILFLQEMDLIMPRFEPVDILAVIEATIQRQKTRADEQNVCLILQKNGALPAIPADARSLGRVFFNILDNAIKFSPQGGDVLIDISSDTQQITVNVQDHGVGIPPEALPHIFERFFHVDEMGGQLFRGAGLGLSIASQVVEQHGGRIDVISTPGEGSEFTVRFPLQDSPTDDTPEPG
jgi:signal transduction histidine kinase